MKGKLIYFAPPSLLGLLAAFENVYLFTLLMAVFSLFLVKRKNFRAPQIGVACLLFVIFFIAGKTAVLQNETTINELENRFQLIFNQETKVDGDVLHAHAAVSGRYEKIALRYYIATEQEQEFIRANIMPGTKCSAYGELSSPALPTNLNAFNYRDFLYRKGIFWTFEAEKIDLQSCMRAKPTPFSFLQSIRQKGTAYIDRHFPEATAQVSAALIFGDRNLYNPETMKNYQAVGIIHLLAISGLQVALLAGMIFICGVRVGITREKMINALFLFLPVYAILTGASPSVNRSCLMLLLVLASMKIKGKYKISPADAISLAFVIYLAISPFAIYNAGFQLSFVVSFFLVASSRILSRFHGPISQLVAVSFVAQLGSLPILLYHFYELSLISLFANVLFVPFFSAVLLPLTLIIFLLHLLSARLAGPLLFFLNLIIETSDQLANILSSIPFSTFTLGRPSWLLLLFYLVTTVSFFLLWEKMSDRWQITRIIWLIIIPLTVHSMSHYISPAGEVTFIDVGQGDSSLIILPNARGTYLIDTGGTVRFGETEQWRQKKDPFEVGSDVLVPFLKSKGIRQIDKLILTHGDADHLGGALSLIGEIKVAEILMPQAPDRAELERQVIAAAVKEKVPIKFVTEGMGWNKGTAAFEIISPDPAAPFERNNSSIVVRAHFGGLDWLFTGDLEAEGEELLLRKHRDLHADVLKAGHHGSKTSTSEPFINQLQPKAAIISAGRKNRFGHPHPEVVARLEDRNIKIFRTDQQGAITYTFRGNSGTFSSVLP
ncbi:MULTISPECIES: DNA internalization-related competence protein ComEC/Rec2 [Bacillus]|uniref:DNA internalization-related competence protein ComEC/Rec2 n=1 Tax=Bacillus TaxID=1386 RepID=UPI000C7560DF|nr:MULTISPECIES: DNA internalization-related competence protein ComEC/Rec2 [Bacillus]PLR87662.1 DNA internalization-related competence protein ComEC/Rec2 [Bacillus sp. V33-4]RSK56268.1 DNA internalization-related competence protein ComEC/Rec2 [Bacillus canaveralius]